MRKYIIGIIALLSAGAITAQAQQVWDNGAGDGQWNTTSANWDAGSVWTDTGNAIFGAGETIALTEAINAGTVAITHAGIGLTDYTFSGSALNVSSGITVDGGGNVGGDWVIFKNAISGAGSLTSDLVGRLELEETSTYTGGTIINAGDVQVEADNALGTGLVTVNSGRLRSDNGSFTIVNDITFTTAGERIELRDSNETLTLTGDVNVNVDGVKLDASSDTAALAFGGAFGGSASSVVFDRGIKRFLSTATVDSTMEIQFGNGNDPASIEISNGRNLANNLVVNGGRASDPTTLGLINGDSIGTFSGDIRSNDSDDGGFDLRARVGETVTFSGVLSDDGNGAGIDKTGVGTVILSGDNTQDGRIIVEAGLLVIDGDSSAATGDLTVSIGALLGGSGIIGGAATVNGMLNPGNSPGTLTFNEALDLAADSLTTFEIVDLANFDVLANDGEDTITFADSADIVFDTTGYTAVLDDSFVVLENWASYGGTVANLDITGTDLGGGLSFDTSTLLTDGLVTVIPEPATLGLVATFGAGILFIRRRLMM